MRRVNLNAVQGLVSVAVVAGGLAFYDWRASVVAAGAMLYAQALMEGRRR